MRVAALVNAVAAGSSPEAATAELVAYLADEVLPHALAEEHTIYRVAATRAELAATVTDMIAEHRSLASGIEQLATASTGPDAARQAEAIAALFAAHVGEGERPIATSVCLSTTRWTWRSCWYTCSASPRRPTRRRRSVRTHRHPTPRPWCCRCCWRRRPTWRRPARETGRAKLAASAWAALRVPRPELAVRVTAALHRLARLVSAEPVTFHAADDGHDRGGDPHLDVRDLARRSVTSRSSPSTTPLPPEPVSFS